jgi:hypothetical protein
MDVAGRIGIARHGYLGKLDLCLGNRFGLVGHEASCQDEGNNSIPYPEINLFPAGYCSKRIPFKKKPMEIVSCK